MTAHAFAIERIARELELAGHQDRYAQAIAALERDAAVDVDGLDAVAGAKEREQIREQRLA
jgi:hypothetical protein